MAFSPNPRRPELLFNNTLRSCALLLGASGLLPMVNAAATKNSAPATIPSQAQFIDQKAFNVLAYVPPPAEFNGTSGPFVPPGYTLDSLLEKPFHIYDKEFATVLGTNPSLTLVGKTEKDPVFHEAVVWTPETDEVFFVQNAGSPDAGTGLNKSAIILKISLADAAVASAAKIAGRNDTLVTVTTVNSTPAVINPNGATNFRGQIVYAGEGQGDKITSALYLMNPKAPYNTTVLVNNYFGRQFSSLNDLAVHPVSRDLYFTDTLYGYLQDFRPAPGLRNQVYRWVEETGALTVVADDFVLPNGITFSPDGKYAYVTDSGMQRVLQGKNYSDPASIYRYDVKKDGTFDNRKTFAYADSSVPDGVHCDAKGNVYAGCGDGVHVWNPSGTLIGKIFLGTGAANFQFAGKGRMVICAETELYYVTLAAEGAIVESEM
ncbi:evolved d-pantonohydrolase [Ophiostoma piceae UAMH 11346]|uniref:Evolved d-pantonohydrolase n=1 Tax=Ophiostoma piceae (strain UAMH 11346) TaxID=1262450 RepID=S3CVZ7_OPHP1|nr:evolved d-pantonohydrolase [Ophiostoma piceae UAMH 11346]